MLTLTIFFISLLHPVLPTTSTFAYNATDIILLDCGSPSSTTSVDGRNWDADTVYFPFNDQSSSSFSLNVSHPDPSVPTVPYTSALIIKSKFTNSFHVSPGPKFLRLYFYPEKYSNFDMTTIFFSVTANSYTLLKNFSAHMHLINEAFSMKEFIVPVWDNEILNVTFIPSSNSYAFINGIEIVSMPSGIYLSGGAIPLVPVVVGQFLSLDNTTTSLETLHRLNVGGNRIENVEDTGMYRTWSQDGDYLVESNWIIPLFLDQCQLISFSGGTTAYTAPKEVYTNLRMMRGNASLNLKSNMTWKFFVDAGFHYLIRLHFCELLSQVVGPSQHIFDIFINIKTAATNIDVFNMSGGQGIPMYRDYTVMADNSTQGKDLWLALHPQNKSYVDAFLNGLEIFKLNQSDGNLAGPNPDSHQKLLEGPKSKSTSIILPVIGAIFGGFALVSLLVSFFIFQRQRKLKHWLSFTSKFLTTKTSSSLPSDICCHFSMAEIKAATQDFDDALLIGSEGFGNVYRGIMKGGTTIAAIKRLNTSSRQGAHEFRTKIALLSKLRHINLIHLTTAVGNIWCFLMYDNMYNVLPY
ncbi:hypothetical protein SLA2020_359900 [Shorea laevis]